ncbi:MAG TPA: permease, partial [Acidimicrobiales bacterium]|nr:permease [Acidimicrobiales bacterium]
MTAAFLAAGGAADVVARCVVAVLDMLWMTLWALLFGFLLSGAVQRFVSTASMQRRLGDHSWRSVARATSYGAASSSCSYAAAATSRSLLARGADAVSAFVFMVASTNLVIELGAVILGLLGWRFLGAQLAGGLVLVVLLAVVGSRVLRGRVVDSARARLAAASEVNEAPDCHEHPGSANDRPSLHSVEGWSEAAGLGLGDAKMVQRELLVGFVLAGVLSVVVPVHGWSALFLHGHGAWTTLENALLAPVIAALSCVCSVGNVPLAAVLWRSGIGFTGTLAFLFADVLAIPLL